MEANHTGCARTTLGHQRGRGTSQPQHPHLGVLCPPSRTCAIKSAQSALPALLTAWHLKTTTEAEERDLYFASCSFCCYKGPKPLTPSHLEPSGTLLPEPQLTTSSIPFLDGGGRGQTMHLSIGGNIFFTRATMEIHTLPRRCCCISN